MRLKLIIPNLGIIFLFLIFLFVFLSFSLASGYKCPFIDQITITSPVAYQIIQRGENSRADILVTGRYVGEPSSIEASWNGGAFAIISEDPSNGIFNGVLKNQSAGQGILSVRFTNNKKVLSMTPNVGIGDIYVIAGQSNASGRGENNQTYNAFNTLATLFGNDDKWRRLQDPTDSSLGQVDAISSEGLLAGGSIWPPLASEIVNDQGVPVAFIPTAKGLTSITQWQRNDSSPSDANTLYGSMSRRINAVGGIKAVLFWQGESDAISGMSQAVYKENIVKIAEDIYRDFGVSTIVAQIGIVSGVKSENINNIRAAQKLAWNESEYILEGPILYDIDINDNVHFTTDQELAVAAERWWTSIKEQLY